MAKKSVPKSRLNINYDTKVNGVLKKKELPYKVLVVGDLSKGKSDDVKQEFAERQIRRMDNGVDRALSDMNINLDIEVPNFMSKNSENIKVDYKLNAVKDFKPDAVAKKVPQINAMLKLKEMLVSFAKDVDNNRNLKKLIDEVFSNKEELELLKSKIPNLDNYSIKQISNDNEPTGGEE